MADSLMGVPGLDRFFGVGEGGRTMHPDWIGVNPSDLRICRASLHACHPLIVLR